MTNKVFFSFYSLNSSEDLDQLLTLTSEMKSDRVTLKTLLIIEFLFRTTKLSKEVLLQKLETFLDQSVQSSDKGIKIKAEKLKLILSRL